METKRCFKCGETKTVDNFYKKSAAKDGLQANCKSCKTKYNKSHYQENIESYKARRKLWRETNGKPWQLHNISEEEFQEMFNRFLGLCWCCNRKVAFQIDHDHECCPGPYSCGKCVRGILCMSCNTAIGRLG